MSDQGQKSNTGIFIVLGVLIVVVIAGLAVASGQFMKPGESATEKVAAVNSGTKPSTEPAAGEEGAPAEAAPEEDVADADAPEPLKIRQGNPVVAKVDGQDIMRGEVFGFIQNLPEDMRKLPIQQLYPLALEQVINAKVVEEKVAGANLDSNEEVKKQLEQAKKQIVRNVFIQQKVNELVTEDRLKKSYDEYIENVGDVEETKARHILVETEDEARDLLAKLNDGAAFEDLAKEHSTGPSAERGGDLGWFTKEEMVPEFAEYAFEIKPGNVGKKPVKTQFGWHVVKVEERRMRPKPEFEAVKPFLEVQIRREALAELVNGWREKAEVEQFDINGDPIEPSAGQEAPEDAE